jgi:hypothetical protein
MEEQITYQHQWVHREIHSVSQVSMQQHHNITVSADEQI